MLCLVVGIFLLLESCGIPILNSSLLLFAGAVASLGHVNIVVLALVAIIGSTSGACLAYLVGSRGGEPALKRLLTRLRVDMRRVERARGWFSNAGGRMIFLSRIVPYIRPFACFFGGIAQMPFRRFFIAALSGSILWCVAALSTGWALGRRWRLALYLIQVYTLPTLGVLALALAVYILVKVFFNRRRSHNRQQADASKATDAEARQDGNLLEV
jgi:membrane protein DedA with SNARE-associated domain